MKFDFNDVLIEPVEVSDIRSRRDIDIRTSESTLPIITAPMDTVIDSENEEFFWLRGIQTCLPRGEKSDVDFPSFKSYSLTDFNRTFLHIIPDHDKIRLELTPKLYVLIDIANGHMKEVLDSTREAKECYGDSLVLMVGNVANPKTYVELSNAGADYIRIGIGNGGGCLTTQQTGVGYPMGSLIQECYRESVRLNNPAKIVADGGMKTYSDVIKAIGLGADYVMLGSILNKALESSGNNYLFKKIPVPESIARWAYRNNFSVYKKFRGMSTKEVQKKWGNTELKTSEGVVRYRKVEYTLDQWIENFQHYLRSAMSYSNAKTLDEFKGYAIFNHITENAYKRFNK